MFSCEGGRVFRSPRPPASRLPPPASASRSPSGWGSPARPSAADFAGGPTRAPRAPAPAALLVGAVLRRPAPNFWLCLPGKWKRKLGMAGRARRVCARLHTRGRFRLRLSGLGRTNMSNINMINQAMLPTNSAAWTDRRPLPRGRRGGVPARHVGTVHEVHLYPDSFAVADDGKPCSSRPHTHTRTARSLSLCSNTPLSISLSLSVSLYLYPSISTSPAP